MGNLIEINKSALLSMGFAFHGDIPKKVADPEKTVIQILNSFFDDRKLFRMLFTWLNITSDLLHIERFNTLLEKLSPQEKVILFVLSQKLIKRDRRWKIIAKRLEGKVSTVGLEVPSHYRDAFLISKHGTDDEFRKLGLRIERIIPEDEKKILSLPGILKANGWLRLRALMGPNYRADIAFLFLSNLASGPADAARLLGCARDTAYRNWRALEDANVRQIIQLSA